MSLNSINTNQAAYVALQSLNSTNSALQATQKAVSTGYRVSDDGGAFAIAERVRSDVGALTTVNQQLGNAKGLVGTTLTGLTNISTLLKTARATLVTLADGNTTGSQRTEAIQTYKQTLASIKSDIQGSDYNGKTLIGNITGSSGTFAKANLIRNEQGATYGVATFSGSAFFGSLSFTGTQLNGAASVAGLISQGGVLLKTIADRRSACGERNWW